jgi:hypothetical protein
MFFLIKGLARARQLKIKNTRLQRRLDQLLDEQESLRAARNIDELLSKKGVFDPQQSMAIRFEEQKARQKYFSLERQIKLQRQLVDLNQAASVATSATEVGVLNALIADVKLAIRSAHGDDKFPDEEMHEFLVIERFLIAVEMVMRCPVDSGRLVRSIRLFSNPNKKYDPGPLVGSSSPEAIRDQQIKMLERDISNLSDSEVPVISVGAPHWKYVEYGTAKMRPQPFIRIPHSVLAAISKEAETLSSEA